MGKALKRNIQEPYVSCLLGKSRWIPTKGLVGGPQYRLPRLLSEVLGGLIYFSAPGLMTGTARYRIPVRGVARLSGHLRFPHLHQQDGTANHVRALL